MRVLLSASIVMALAGLPAVAAAQQDRKPHRVQVEQPRVPVRPAYDPLNDSRGNAALGGNNANSAFGDNSANSNANGRTSGGGGGMN